MVVAALILFVWELLGLPGKPGGDALWLLSFVGIGVLATLFDRRHKRIQKRADDICDALLDSKHEPLGRALALLEADLPPWVAFHRQSRLAIAIAIASRSAARGDWADCSAWCKAIEEDRDFQRLQRKIGPRFRLALLRLSARAAAAGGDLEACNEVLKRSDAAEFPREARTMAFARLRSQDESPAIEPEVREMLAEGARLGSITERFVAAFVLEQQQGAYRGSEAIVWEEVDAFARSKEAALLSAHWPDLERFRKNRCAVGGLALGEGR